MLGLELKPHGWQSQEQGCEPWLNKVKTLLYLHLWTMLILLSTMLKVVHTALPISFLFKSGGLQGECSGGPISVQKLACQFSQLELIKTEIAVRDFFFFCGQNLFGSECQNIVCILFHLDNPAIPCHFCYKCNKNIMKCIHLLCIYRTFPHQHLNYALSQA